MKYTPTESLIISLADAFGMSNAVLPADYIADIVIEVETSYGVTLTSGEIIHSKNIAINQWVDSVIDNAITYLSPSELDAFIAEHEAMRPQSIRRAAIIALLSV